MWNSNLCPIGWGNIPSSFFEGGHALRSKKASHVVTSRRVTREGLIRSHSARFVISGATVARDSRSSSRVLELVCMCFISCMCFICKWSMLNGLIVISDCWFIESALDWSFSSSLVMDWVFNVSYLYFHLIMHMHLQLWGIIYLYFLSQILIISLCLDIHLLIKEKTKSRLYILIRTLRGLILPNKTNQMS